MPLPEIIEGRVASLSDIGNIESGAINVTITDIETNNTVLVYGAQSDVSQSTETTIVTVTSNGLKFITQIFCSGNENAVWRVYIDSAIKMEQRTTSRQANFNFDTPLRLNASSTLDVKAIHYGPDTTSDFTSSVLGYATV